MIKKFGNLLIYCDCFPKRLKRKTSAPPPEEESKVTSILDKIRSELDGAAN